MECLSRIRPAADSKINEKFQIQFFDCLDCGIYLNVRVDPPPLPCGQWFMTFVYRVDIFIFFYHFYHFGKGLNSKAEWKILRYHGQSQNYHFFFHYFWSETYASCASRLLFTCGVCPATSWHLSDKWLAREPAGPALHCTLHCENCLVGRVLCAVYSEQCIVGST